jgi:hypothetical protein
MTPREQLPVVVIGAGPIGLAAAVHLLDKGAEPLVLEAGAGVGTNVLSWAHVRVFSPWRYNVDELAARLLALAGWQAPDPDAFPTGGELVVQYLKPLSEVPALRSRIRTSARVVGVARLGADRTKTKGRETLPFVVRVATAAGEEHVLARAIIDASGTVATANPLGASGMPAIGEAAVARRVFYGIPDVLGRDRARYAGRRTLVVGSGHSAFNTLLELAELADAAPDTRIVWAIRRAEIGNLFGGGSADQLPERGRLGVALRSLVEQGRLSMTLGFRLMRIEQTASGLVASSDGEALPPVDEIVCATGFRPDFEALREIRLDLDPVIESPTALAPVIDPNVHSCGTVPPHGEDLLRQPEADFYLAGMKAYGRAPNFLMLTGYEQVRSIACALTGDAEGAARVGLELPATGVCSSDPVTGASSCCEPAPAESSACCAPAPATSESASGCCAAPAPTVVKLGALRGPAGR